MSKNNRNMVDRSFGIKSNKFYITNKKTPKDRFQEAF